MVIQMIVIERLEMKINLMDKGDEVDNKVKKEEQYIWSLLLLLLS